MYRDFDNRRKLCVVVRKGIDKGNEQRISVLY
jgi:hypothetical protein